MTTTDDGQKAADAGPLGPRGVRLLKILIGVMTAMIILGLLAVVVRVIQLSEKSPRPPAGAGTGDTARGELRLPTGAMVRHLALSGDRIAVHFDSPSGAGIAVVDAMSGLVVSRIDLKPEAPR